MRFLERFSGSPATCQRSLPSQEGFSKIASRLIALDLAPAIFNWPAQRPPTRRPSPHGDARWPSAKRQGGPHPPETKVGVSFRFDALGNGIMQRILEYHRFAEECRKLAS